MKLLINKLDNFSNLYCFNYVKASNYTNLTSLGMLLFVSLKNLSKTNLNKKLM